MGIKAVALIIGCAKFLFVSQVVLLYNNHLFDQNKFRPLQGLWEKVAKYGSQSAI